MGELVVTSKGKLQSNTESLDGHDGDRSDGRADREVDEGVPPAVDGGNLVDHKDGECDNSDGVEKEA